jgi:hypothetical protein
MTVDADDKRLDKIVYYTCGGLIGGLLLFIYLAYTFQW